MVRLPAPPAQASDVDIGVCSRLSFTLNAVLNGEDLGSRIQKLCAVTQRFLTAGARPDTCVERSRSAALVCDENSILDSPCLLAGWAPLLDVLLDHKYNPPLNLNFSMKRGDGSVVTPLGFALSLPYRAGSSVPAPAPYPYAIRRLVAAGADPLLPCHQSGEPGKGLSFPLHLIASQIGSQRSTAQSLIECVDIILNAVRAAGRGVDRALEARNGAGETALAAVLNQDPGGPDRSPLALHLIEAGADINARMPVSQSRCFDLAAGGCLLDVMAVMVGRGGLEVARPVSFLVPDDAPAGIGADRGAGVAADSTTPPPAAAVSYSQSSHYLQVAVEKDLVEVLRFASDHGIDLSKVRVMGTLQPPLIIAAVEHNSPKCFRFLLSLPGQDPSMRFSSFAIGFGGTKTRPRYTILDRAVQAQRWDMVATLREAGGKSYAEIKTDRERAAAPEPAEADEGEACS